MKKVILTLCLIGTLMAAKAQTKPVPISQQEATQVINSLQAGLRLIHRLDISALKRDSLDMYIGAVCQFMDDRNKLAKADTVKVKPVIKKP